MAKTADEALGAFTITSAALVDDETFAFVAHADETNEKWKGADVLPARLVTFNLRTGNWGWKGYDGFTGGTVAGGRSVEGHKMALFTNNHRQVVAFHYKNGPNGEEPPIPAYPDGHFLSRMRFIGTRFYGVGFDFSVSRRNGPEDWEVLHADPDGDQLTAIGGFSETDIYAAGREEMLLHFDGSEWTRQELPYDAVEEAFRASDLICAPDGVVYVCGQDGQLLSGRAGESWRLVISMDEAPMSELTGMCWFRDQLFATSHSAIYRLVDEAWELADFEGSELQPVASGFLDASDNVMLAAGPFGAAIYDGDQWTPIHGSYDDLDLLRIQLLDKLTEDLTDIRDAARQVAEGTSGD